MNEEKGCSSVAEGDFNPFAATALQIHQEKCSEDLLYSLLFEPSLHLKVVLENFIKVVEKKNEPKFGQSELLALWKESITQPYADEFVRQYAFLFMLGRTPDLQQFLRQKIPEHKQDTYGKFIAHLQEMIKKVIPWPVRTHNATKTVREFVFEAAQFYRTK